MSIKALKILLVFPALFFSTIDCSKSNRASWLEPSIKPIIWKSEDLSIKQDLADFQSGEREIHPLDIGMALVYTAYKYLQTDDEKYESLSMGYLELVETLYSDPRYYSNNTFTYNFSHNDLKPGWWSGMANSAIIFGLTLCDDVYGTDHHEIIGALINNLGTDYSEGGCLYPIDKNKAWILEYAWPGIDKSSAKFVLNGFLYSLICLKMAHTISPNPNLAILFNKGLKGLEHKKDAYYFKGVKWTKYDLNPTIEPPHYAIFDLALFESLAGFSKESKDWIEQAVRERSDILKQGYKLDIQEKSKSAYTALFSLIGPPSPYWIDIFPIEIQMVYSDGKTEVINSYPPKEFEMDIYKRGFISFDLEKDKLSEIEKIVVNSKYLGQKQELFFYDTDDLRKLVTSGNGPEPVQIGELQANYDGVFQDSIVKIEVARKFNSDIESYKNTVAQVVIPLSDTLYCKESEKLVFKVNTSEGITDHKFFINADKGRIFQRYYRNIPKGENVIVLNLLDFEGYDATMGIEKIVWQIYTHNMDEDVDITIDDIFKIKSLEELEKIRAVKGSVPKEIRAESLAANFDGFVQDSVVKIVPQRVYTKELESYKSSVAQIVIPFLETRYFEESENIILKVENSVDVTNHKFFIYDDDGKFYQRYYLPILKGKNIIALNPVGFENYNKEKGIKKIVWQIYTDNLAHEGSIKINHILKTENNFQLRSTFEDSSYIFEEKKIRGNIY